MANEETKVYALNLFDIADREAGDWHSYLEQPTSNNVRPVSATVLSGNVSNARGLTSHAGGVTTLTVTSGNDPATILLDYGEDVEGSPYIDVKSYNTPGASPTVSLAFTEARGYLRTPDQARSRQRLPPGPRPWAYSQEVPAAR